MPPALDIYGLTHRRDKESINHFVDTYIDRVASEDRGDEEIMMESLDSDMEESYDIEPAISLTNIIERGLSQPPRAFTIYFHARQEEFERVMLSFISDNQLILGLSIDDEGALPENQKRAENLLEIIMNQYDCHLGLILVEKPPPLSENKFRNAVNHSLTMVFKDRHKGE